MSSITHSQFHTSICSAYIFRDDDVQNWTKMASLIFREINKIAKKADAAP